MEIEFLLAEFIGLIDPREKSCIIFGSINQFHQLTFSWTHPSMIEHSPIFEVGHN